MKKLSVGLVALLLTLGLQPALADQESPSAIAIIDVNFEPQLVDGQVTEICLMSQALCDTQPVLRRATEFKTFNHGTIMADIVRANNATAHLVLIEAGSTKTGVITGVHLHKALNWVEANAATYGIKAVSFSYNSGNGDRCTPVSPGVKVDITHSGIVTAITKLKAAGIKFYAASGNYGSGDRIDYPACIQDAIAVGSTNFRGSVAKSDIVISGHTYTSSKLRSDQKSLQDSNALGLIGASALRVGSTTSVTTAIAAATNR